MPRRSTTPSTPSITKAKQKVRGENGRFTRSDTVNWPNTTPEAVADELAEMEKEDHQADVAAGIGAIAEAQAYLQSPPPTRQGLAFCLHPFLLKKKIFVPKVCLLIPMSGSISLCLLAIVFHKISHSVLVSLLWPLWEYVSWWQMEEHGNPMGYVWCVSWICLAIVFHKI